MLNLIKMNFFRLFRSKSFYVLLGVTTLVSFLTLFLFKFMLGISAAMAAESAEEADIIAAMSTTITLPELFDFILTFLLLLCGLGAAFIAHAEDKNGFIKNIAGQVFPRGIQAAAKLPVLLFEIAAMYTISILVFLAYAIFNKMVVVGSVPVLLKNLGIHLLLFLAFDAVIMLLTILTKKTTLGIVLTIFAMTNILNLVYSLINYTLHKYLHMPASFDVTNFALDTYIRLDYSPGTAPSLKGLVAGLIYLTACTALSWLIIKKRDI